MSTLFKNRLLNTRLNKYNKKEEKKKKKKNWEDILIYISRLHITVKLFNNIKQIHIYMFSTMSHF